VAFRGGAKKGGVAATAATEDDDEYRSKTHDPNGWEQPPLLVLPVTKALPAEGANPALALVKKPTRSRRSGCRTRQIIVLRQERRNGGRISAEKPESA
jgi:hypothetical protein